MQFNSVLMGKIANEIYESKVSMEEILETYGIGDPKDPEQREMARLYLLEKHNIEQCDNCGVWELKEQLLKFKERMFCEDCETYKDETEEY